MIVIKGKHEKQLYEYNVSFIASAGRLKTDQAVSSPGYTKKQQKTLADI